MQSGASDGDIDPGATRTFLDGQENADRETRDTPAETTKPWWKFLPPGLFGGLLAQPFLLRRGARRPLFLQPAPAFPADPTCSSLARPFDETTARAPEP